MLHVPPVPKSTTVIMNYSKPFSREKHCIPIFLYESGAQLLKKLKKFSVYCSVFPFSGIFH